MDLTTKFREVLSNLEKLILRSKNPVKMTMYTSHICIYREKERPGTERSTILNLTVIFR